jgi:hypothetical protein
MNPRRWIDNVPPLPHPGARAWWTVGRCHLNALEHTVFDGLGGQLHDASQRLRDEFPRLANWRPFTGEDEIMHLEQGIAACAQAGCPQEHALTALARKLGELLRIQELSRQPGDAAVAELIAKMTGYCDTGSATTLIDKVLALIP